MLFLALILAENEWMDGVRNLPWHLKVFYLTLYLSWKLNSASSTLNHSKHSRQNCLILSHISGKVRKSLIFLWYNWTNCEKMCKKSLSPPIPFITDFELKMTSSVHFFGVKDKFWNRSLFFTFSQNLPNFCLSKLDSFLKHAWHIYMDIQKMFVQIFPFFPDFRDLDDCVKVQNTTKVIACGKNWLKENQNWQNC